MNYVLLCIGDAHDRGLLGVAALVCLVGVYASFMIAQHSARSQGGVRQRWALIGIGAAAATAWATHMIGLLAYHPGLMSAFDPIPMVLSLIAAAGGIAWGMSISIGQRNFMRRFGGGIVIGCGIVLLHYLGQASYLVRGNQSFDLPLVALSALLGMLTFGYALAMSGVRRKHFRIVAAPLLLLGIAILHFGGMAALRIEPDPRVQFPAHALPAEVVAPIVAVVSCGLVVLAFLGLRFSIAAARQLRLDTKRLAELANVTVEGIAVCAEGKITSINSSLAKLSGYTREQIEGEPIGLLLPGIEVEALPLLEEHEAQLIRTDQDTVPVRILRSQVQLGSRTQTIIAVRDQRERMRTESKMRTLAYTDTLTGLPNRLSVVEMMQGLARPGHRPGRGFAFLLLDLDRFKWVNDTLGHPVGDGLLQEVARRLRNEAPEGGFVGRLGGDEFAVIVRGNEAAATEAARRLIAVIGEPFSILGHAIEVRASIGIAMAPDGSADHEDLTRNADLALYRAKDDGGGALRFFEPSMHERAQQRRTMEIDLRQALLLGQLQLHYQPQVDPVSNRISGAEALIRWSHPQRGMVPPDQFIPLAEEVGLIGAIGEWVLETACREAASWPDDITIAVNLSPLQLRSAQFPARVEAVLNQTGLAAGRLELEVTETSLMQDDDTTYRNLRRLQALGVRISLDDFGTGYSSLSYLRRFPFDKLKIDRSFVRNIPQDKDSVAIVQAIVTLARTLRMTITVEGVETPEQKAFAAANGCHQIQGYLVSKAVPPTTLTGMLATNRRLKASA